MTETTTGDPHGTPPSLSPDGRYLWDGTAWHAVGPALAPPGQVALQTESPGPLRCRFCGATPAAPVTLRELAGIVIYLRWRKFVGLMCRDCGTSAFRRVMRSTMVGGWWAFWSVVANPIVIAMDVVQYRQIKQLAPAVRPEGSRPLPAERPLGRQALPVLLTSAYAVGVIALIVAGVVEATAPFTPREQQTIGECVQRGDTQGSFVAVDCTSAHVGKVVSLSHDSRSCATNHLVVQLDEGSGSSAAYMCVDPSQ